ncbi:hypothetical protein ACLBXM_18455 [Xanthobacteraceae bacterium A53D]
MRADVIILGALVVAASASIFGGLSRAEPAMVETAMVVEAPQAAPAPLAAAEPCTRRAFEPTATSLRFLGSAVYDATDLNIGCTITH